MGYPYRCTNRNGSRRENRPACGYRQTLPHRVHFKECPKCGGEMREDKTRRKYIKEQNCKCDGVWFSMKGAPHRRGTIGCVHYTGELSPEETYYQTPRVDNL